MPPHVAHCVTTAAFSVSGQLCVETESTSSCHWLLDGGRAVEIAERALQCDLRSALDAGMERRSHADPQRSDDVLSRVELTHFLVRHSWLH